MERFIDILMRSPFFTGLTKEEILAVAGCIEAKIIHRRADQYIFRTGDNLTSMGIVLTGSVLVIQEDLWGHRNIIARSGEGESFGESFAVLQDKRLNLSVVANEDCNIMLVNTSKLINICPNACQYHNKIVNNLVSVFAKKLMSLNEKITHISKRTTREKLLSYLSSESIRQNKLSFDIPFDRQQLADYLCVERAAMSAELSKLKKEGVLKTTKSHFELIGVER